MASVKSVYVVTDLEGVSGVDDWNPRLFDPDYARNQRSVKVFYKNPDLPLPD
jgi:hypothetical protein